MSGGSNRRAVIVYKDDKVFGEYESINQAYMATGSDMSNIVKCCNGRQKLSLGYRFEYKEKR